MKKTLIDAGPIIAFYDGSDAWHQRVMAFLSSFKGRFVTTMPVVTEAMHRLGGDFRAQNELLSDLSRQLFEIENLQISDFRRIAHLNSKYSDLPGDFADLTLIALAERLDIDEIFSLDSDFDVYRLLRKKPFKRIGP